MNEEVQNVLIHQNIEDKCVSDNQIDCTGHENLNLLVIFNLITVMIKIIKYYNIDSNQINTFIFINQEDLSNHVNYEYIDQTECTSNQDNDDSNNDNINEVFE